MTFPLDILRRITKMGRPRKPYPRVTGKGFIEWLAKAGLVPERTHRVVMEAMWDGAVTMYVEQYASSDCIKVEPPDELKGAKIVILPKKETEE